MKKNVAVIGCGYWGKNHVRTFYELGALSTICDVSENRLLDLRKQYPSIQITTDLNDVWNDRGIEAVVISAPAAQHYELTKAALKKGKDVLVEKPLALEVNEGEELVKLADANKKILMVGHILEYHAAVDELKKLVNKGELGKINYIYSNRLNFGKIRHEENILWSFAPHDISIILSLLGEGPSEVSAHGGNYLQHDIADVTLSTLSFRSGVKAHIFVSWLHPFKEQKLVIVGTKKMAVFDDMAKTDKLLLYPHRVDWQNRAPIAVKAEAEIVKLNLEEPLRAECQHFIDCIRDRKTPLTDGKSGLEVLRVLNALQSSLEGGGKHITLKQTGSSEREYFVHETAIVDDGALIGRNSKIWHFSHIMSGARLGDKCNVGQNVVVSPGVEVGNNVKIQNNVSLYTGVQVEDDAFLGPSMVFTNVFNPRSFIERKHEYKKTLIRKGATIGANATIICGRTIGEYSFIGAGAVVTKDVPPYALAYGSPAKVYGWMCKCGIKLPMKVNDGREEAKCPTCGLSYSRDGFNVSQTRGTDPGKEV